MSKFIGVGVGPGSPDLLTLRAAKTIAQATTIAYLINDTGHSQAKTIARYAFEENSNNVNEIPIFMPMNNNRQSADQVYDAAAKTIKEYLVSGQDVVFLCEGDPLFFGSFSYLLTRINQEFDCEVIPGITSINAGSARLTSALTMLSDSLVVLSGYHTSSELREALDKYDSVVIMKAGRARQKIVEAINESGRADQARYLEYIGRDNEKIVEEIHLLKNTSGPYFSLFIVTRCRQEGQNA